MTKKEQKNLRRLWALDPTLPNIYSDKYKAEGFVPNGCTCSPDRIAFTWITPVCDYHDFLYWKGGTEEDRSDADKELRRLMILSVRLSVPKWYPKWMIACRKRRMVRWARRYYKAVRKWGKEHFTTRKKRSCVESS